MRLAPEETSMELTGYGHNAVTCIGMKTDIPVRLDMWSSIGFLWYIDTQIFHHDNKPKISAYSHCLG